MKTILALALVVFGVANAADVHEEIYNGYTAKSGQFPYQALLYNKQQDGNYTVCGGSLIATYYVLTAAHCSYKVVQTTVYLGMTNTNDGTGVYYYEVPSSSMSIHPSYNPNTYQNDLSILKLNGAARYSNQIQNIALPRKAWAPPATFDNYNVTASGWGQTYDNEAGAHMLLQYRTINKMPQSSCVSYYSSINQVTNGMICTDKRVVYAGPCHGDSGGPLTVSLTSGLYLIGAVSWGVGDCSSSNPVAYANVAYYLDWISSVTGITVS